MLRLFGKKTSTAQAGEARTTQATTSFADLVGKGLVIVPNAAGRAVTEETAMQVPAVWAAVNFIAGTIAGLPLHVYERSDTGRMRVMGPIPKMLHDNVNEETTSFEWRKYSYERFLTGGRAFTLILRNGRREPAALEPLDPEKVTVIRREGLKFYEYSDGAAKRVYQAGDVIDLPFMLKSDRLSHVGPLTAGRNAIGQALAVQDYASRFFNGGGVPPFALIGNFQSGDALQRASNDMAAAVQKATAEGRQALTLPEGLDIKPLGVEPEKNQMLETQRFGVEQIARLYSLPPTFLQDLTHGTFSNTEQQDLHFVKHTLRRLIEQFEQELNLKLWGPRNTKFFVEVNVDGLLRGDFKARMEGYSKGIQNAILTPAEVREKENLPPMANSGELLIQGATVPLGSQPNQGAVDAPQDDETEESENED